MFVSTRVSISIGAHVEMLQQNEENDRCDEPHTSPLVPAGGSIHTDATTRMAQSKVHKHIAVYKQG